MTNNIASIIVQLERQRAAIDNAVEALRGVTGQTTASEKGRPKAATKKRGSMSKAGRQRQIEAMRKYWAAKKAGKGAARQAPKKGGLTEAGRKKLSEAMRQRWAAKKSQGKKKRTVKKTAA